MTTHVAKPCPECPFSKSIKPGALGGSSPLVYIGQAVGPFVLPCHKHCDFDDPQWKQKSIGTPQCAGAAAYRSNIGVAPYLPDAIHKLPPSKEVFADHAEFLSHHMKISRDSALALLEFETPRKLLARELAKQEVIYFEGEKV